MTATCRNLRYPLFWPAEFITHSATVGDERREEHTAAVTVTDTALARRYTSRIVLCYT